MSEEAPEFPYDPVCLVIGYVTLLWAQIDTAIDCANFAIQAGFGHPPNWKEIPRTRLNKKIRYLRDAVNNLASLAAAKSEGIAIADEIERLSEERHWIIHGAADVLTNPDSIILTRLRLRGEQLLEERHTSVDEIKRASRASLALSMRLNRFVLVDVLRLSKDEINKMRRELPVRPA